MKQPSRQAWLNYYRHVLKCNYNKYLQAKQDAPQQAANPA